VAQCVSTRSTIRRCNLAAPPAVSTKSGFMSESSVHNGMTRRSIFRQSGAYQPRLQVARCRRSCKQCGDAGRRQIGKFGSAALKQFWCPTTATRRDRRR